MKEQEKLPAPFQVNVSKWSLPQGVNRVVWQIRLNEHIESSGAFSVCYKKLLGC